MGVVVPLPPGHHAIDTYMGHHLNDFQSTVANGVTVKERLAKICQIFDRNGIFLAQIVFISDFSSSNWKSGP